MNETINREPLNGHSPMNAWRPARTESVSTFGAWQDFVHENFPWLEHRNATPGRFGAVVSAHKFGQGELSTISSSAIEVIRTRHLAEVAEAGYIKLMWQIRGCVSLEQDKRLCVIEPGQATVCDTARPYRIKVSDGAEFAVFMLPHGSCPGWGQISQRVCGARLVEGASIRAALGSLMAVTHLDERSSDEDLGVVIQAIQSMITTALHRSDCVHGKSTYRNPRMCKAQEYILENISNPALSVNDIASALCMSRRSLYMLFEECGKTPARFINQVRLEQVMRMLADKTLLNRKLIDIAFDNGFNDYATFSRLFKSQFGLNPSEFRATNRSLIN